MLRCTAIVRRLYWLSQERTTGPFNHTHWRCVWLDVFVTPSGQLLQWPSVGGDVAFFVATKRRSNGPGGAGRRLLASRLVLLVLGKLGLVEAFNVDIVERLLDGQVSTGCHVPSGRLRNSPPAQQRWRGLSSRGGYRPSPFGCPTWDTFLLSCAVFGGQVLTSALINWRALSSCDQSASHDTYPGVMAVRQSCDCSISGGVRFQASKRYWRPLHDFRTWHRATVPLPRRSASVAEC